MLEEIISVGNGYAIFVEQHGFCILKQVALKLARFGAGKRWRKKKSPNF